AYWSASSDSNDDLQLIAFVQLGLLMHAFGNDNAVVLYRDTFVFIPQENDELCDGGYANRLFRLPVDRYVHGGDGPFIGRIHRWPPAVLPGCRVRQKRARHHQQCETVLAARLYVIPKRSAWEYTHHIAPG